MHCSRNVNNFFNVLIQDGADPWIYKHTDGWYYYTQTTGCNVSLWRSRSLTTIDAGERRVVWQPSGDGAACCAIWAPELHFIQSKWYIYFAATTSDNNNANHRMFVLENTNADPFDGSFIMKGQITDSTNKWAIDGTVLQHPNGELYFIWSGWEGDVNVMQILYIAQMSTPWTICSERIEIARPTYSWETNHHPMINEGPEVLIHNEVISLIYSASGSWTNDYCLGLISASVTSDPMQSDSWQKRPDPIFRSTDLVFAPGHASFTKSPDNSEDWIVYHTARFQGSGWTRQIRAQSFSWNSDSTPDFGVPMNPNAPIPIPSGEATRSRYNAKQDILFDELHQHFKKFLLHPEDNKQCDTADSTITFRAYSPKASCSIVIIRACNGSSNKEIASRQLTINNEHKQDVFIVYSGWEQWGTNAIRVNLKEGINTLHFTPSSNSSEIQSLDICPIE